MTRLNKNAGFTFIQILIATAIVAAFVLMAVDYLAVMGKGGNLSRSLSTRYRVLAGIRDIASMPAALRASMCASTGGVSLNPQLLACAGGNPPNNCTGGVEYPLLMFSPLLQRDASGNLLGGVVVSTGRDNPILKRFDSFGSPCPKAGPDCPFIVYTTMKAQCGPAPLPATPPSPITDELTPLPICTVADVIEVIYHVELDPSIATSDPALNAFIGSASGSVTVPVKLISGNVPQ